MVNPTVDESWSKLTEETPEERERVMLDRYNRLAELSEEERRSQLRPMANAEYALPDEKLRPLTVSRLRTLLNMEHDKAATLINSYDAVMQQMPATAAMRRIGLVQTLITEFSVDDESRMRELIPGVFAGAIRRRSREEMEAATSFNEAMSRPEKKKAWWAFWQK